MHVSFASSLKLFFMILNILVQENNFYISVVGKYGRSNIIEILFGSNSDLFRILLAIFKVQFDNENAVC